MAFEYIDSSIDPLFPFGDNRDERIIVEFNGIIHSESEDIFYGLDGCPILEAHPFNTYQRLLTYTPDKVYEEIGYFRPVDLVYYLNDGQYIEMDEVNAILEYAKFNYDFSVSTHISMAEAIKNLMTADYVRNVTFVLANHRDTDILYLIDIIGKELLEKKGSILESNSNIIADIKSELLSMASTNPYTTIITNEYKLILDVLNDYKLYHADTNLFLLRNHSQNMRQRLNDNSVIFEELYTDKITHAINGDVSKSKLENLDFPIKAKFGRFSPTPFILNQDK